MFNGIFYNVKKDIICLFYKVKKSSLLDINGLSRPFLAGITFRGSKNAGLEHLAYRSLTVIALRCRGRCPETKIPLTDNRHQ